MAFSTISKPGTTFGPCKTNCEHRDCRELWSMANDRCVHCGDLIGFDRAFCKDPDADRLSLLHPYVHFACAEDWAESRNRQPTKETNR